MSRRLPPLLLIGSFLTGFGAAQDLESRYRSAVASIERRDAVTAIDLLRSIAEEHPGYRDTHILLGQSHLMMGDDRSAKGYFEQALETDPNDGQAAFLLGFALYQGARYFEAAEVLGRATRMSPAHPLPRMYLGVALLRLGEVERAEIEIRAALRQAPQDPVALTALAELELSLGRYAAAEASVRQGLQSAPDNLDTQLILGRVLLESGRAPQAIEVLKEAAEADGPSRSDLLYLLAQANLRAGNATAGRASLERFRRIRESEERVRILRSSLSTDPDDVESGVELTTLLLELGHRQMAQLHLAKLRRRFPTDARVRALVGSLAD